MRIGIDPDVIEMIKASADIVEFIGQTVELHKNGVNYFGICPFHQEKTPSLSVSPQKKAFYCFGCGANGDIIDFYSKLHNISITKAVDCLASAFNLSSTPVKKSETLEIIRYLNERSRPKEPQELYEILSEGYIDKFIDAPITEWLDNGIVQDILAKYQVRYDISNQRIVYPIRDKNGNLVAFRGRTIRSDYKEARIPKYIWYSRIGENPYLFGQWHSDKIRSISEQNEVILFEGEKSVMKLDGFGVMNSLATFGSHITELQAREMLSLRCKIVVAFDKDKTLADLKKMPVFKKLVRFTDIYFIIDKGNMLGGKDSPIDQGLEVWHSLYETKTRYWG